MLQAVIFDMDGVLTDSERAGVAITCAAAGEMGFNVPESVVLETLGVTWAESAAIYEKNWPDMDVQELFARVRKELLRRAREGSIPLLPGVHRILDTLDRLCVPRVVASSNGPAAIQAYLEGAGIAGRFDHLISGNQCARSKPAPDIFLLAAETLGVPPEGCLVVEDSPNGVKAGRAAGMKVCMIPDLVPFDETLHPFCDLVFPSLTALSEHLETVWGQNHG